VREQRQMDQASAYLYIARVDDIRARRVQEFFGIDWQDPRRYDLRLNLGRMSLEDAAQQIAEVAGRPEFQPTPASAQALQDLTVKARVEAALAVTEETRSVLLNVLVQQGTVYVWGGLPGFGLEREVIRTIQSVEGVRDIVPDFRVVLEKVSVGDIH
jgi:hypothetical protein